jgi:hypothetical protein
MKKDIKTWAIKLRGRSFYSNNDGHPHLYKTLKSALIRSQALEFFEEAKAEPVRVRVRVEEII